MVIFSVFTWDDFPEVVMFNPRSEEEEDVGSESIRVFQAETECSLGDP